jgi:hypothetical protein
MNAPVNPALNIHGVSPDLVWKGQRDFERTGVPWPWRGSVVFHSLSHGLHMLWPPVNKGIVEEVHAERE